jgi:hypothetical protein
MLRMILCVGIHGVDARSCGRVLDDVEIQEKDREVKLFRKVQLEWFVVPFCHFDACTIQAGLSPAPRFIQWMARFSKFGFVNVRS